MVKRVYCYNIKYDNRISYLTVQGPTQLRCFAENGYVNFYNGDSAPDKLFISVDLDENYLDHLHDTEEKIKNTLQEDTGLTVKSFGFMVKD